MKMNSEPIAISMPDSRGEAHRRAILAETELCRRSLLEFVRAAWPLIEPATPFSDNWHIRAICEHLQAVTESKIRKLLITIPPRTGKSSIVSVLWPCWVWVRHSESRWLFASYAQTLSFRDSRRRRIVIESDWYRSRWGNLFSLATDQNVKHEFENTKRGSMTATSTGGAVTGRGGDYICLDDPHDATAMESEVQRESILNWFDLAWSTRGNQAASYREVIIMQRTHELDVAGHVLKQGGWEHLRLPMQFDPLKRCTTSTGWSDPRKEVGELLDPNRFPLRNVEDLKRRLGPYGAAGQLQQEPAPAEGGLIRRAWLRPYRRDGDFIEVEGYKFDLRTAFRFATVDPAVTAKELEDQRDPDYTVLAAWAVQGTHRGPVLCLLDLNRERLEGPDIVPKLKAFHDFWKFSIIGVESIAFQLALFQQAARLGLPVREISQKEDALYRIDRDKTARVYAATPLMADGRFYVPEYAPWLGEYIRELISFPNAAHDDMVDVTTSAIAIAQKMRGELLPERERPKPRRLDVNVNDLRDDEPRSEWDGIRLQR